MRALLRRQIWRPLQRPFLRYQHDIPHKEYFQNPGQTPLPDATPYPPAFPSPPSYFRRGLRSIAWAALFGSLGLASGVGLLTWDYLQPPFEPGSEEDQEMVEEIEEMMDTHPLIQDLREAGWKEKSFKPADNRYLQTLSGTQGLSLRGFHNTTGWSILVFYTGSGIEGWPDVIHGGLITTLFYEAVNVEATDPAGPHLPSEYQAVIDFVEPVRPGEIYSILVPPATMLAGEKGTETVQIVVQCLLLHLESMPQITIEVDEITKDRMDTVGISNSSSVSIYANATVYLTVPGEIPQANAIVEDKEDEEKA